MKLARIARSFSICLFAGLGVNAHAAGRSTEFSMPVTDSFRIVGAGTVLTGKIASGTLAVGENVGVLVADVNHKEVRLEALLNSDCD